MNLRLEMASPEKKTELNSIFERVKKTNRDVLSLDALKSKQNDGFLVTFAMQIAFGVQC